MEAVVAMVKGVKALGLETCMTLGMLDLDQAVQLKNVGLDYYNHNIDTSERYYGQKRTSPKNAGEKARRSPRPPMLFWRDPSRCRATP
jgi:hypothetical protein